MYGRIKSTFVELHDAETGKLLYSLQGEDLNGNPFGQMLKESGRFAKVTLLPELTDWLRTERKVTLPATVEVLSSAVDWSNDSTLIAPAAAPARKNTKLLWLAVAAPLLLLLKR